MSYREVMALPLRVFWLLNKNIDRIAAETDLRMLMTVASAQSTEALQNQADKLREQMGKVVELDEVKIRFSDATLDVEGLNELRTLGRLA